MVKSVMLSTLVTRFGTAGLDKFKKSWPNDWLIWEPGTWRPPASSTLVVEPNSGPSPARGAEALAFTLEPLPEITLGRGDTCDLCINDATLSQLHLIFSRTATGWTVKDPGSTNGTTLDGGRLPPNRAFPLVTGARLKAGHVVLTFYEPAGLHLRLKSPKSAG